MKRFNTATAGKISLIGAGALLAALLLGVMTSQGANTADKKNGGTNDEAALLTPTNFPASVFDLTASKVKDPFFPLSSRSAIPVPAVMTNIAPSLVSVKDFMLNGMSTTDGDGTGTLVIINGHSFALGETFDITTLISSRKVKVTVLKIKEFSAVIQAEGALEPLEISLPASAQ